MVEIAVHQPGTFCFIEAGSFDIESSSRFYAELFGWEVDEHVLADGDRYSRFLLRGAPVAGMYETRAEQDANAIPSQWLSYVSVEDAAATLKIAIGLGATLLGDVVEVPGVVTVAEFVDPQGAICGLWQPGTHIGASYLGEPGTLTWNDLVASDPTEAASFYCDVFGWTFETEELPSGTYHFFSCGNSRRAGLTSISRDMDEESPSWRAHIGVSDLDHAMAKLNTAGGLVESEASRVPGLGRRVAVKDPNGLSFMLTETEASMVPMLESWI